MDCSVIIVSWNVRDMLRRCLETVRKNHGPFSIEVIVVDNNSSDGSVAMVQEEFPWVRCIALPENTGFARANNRALREATGRYIVILNPDTEVMPGSFETLVQYMNSHPEVALAAPKLLNPDRSFQHGSIRRNPTLLSQLIILLKLRRVFYSAPFMRKYYFDDFDSDREQEVDQIMGAAMFFRRSALDRHGSFDERFFLWFEEVDLCLRLKRAGEHIRYVPAATVIHHAGQSFKQRLPLSKQRIYNTSAVQYFKKNYGPFAAAILSIAVPINLVLTAVYQLVRPHGTTTPS